jgi:hypothetical protein
MTNGHYGLVVLVKYYFYMNILGIA